MRPGESHSIGVGGPGGGGGGGEGGDPEPCDRRDHGPFLEKIDQYFCRDNGQECDYRAEQYRTNHSEARGPIPNTAH
jgi:hypothetical protein